MSKSKSNQIVPAQRQSSRPVRPDCKFELVTPEMAEEYLKHNLSNRRFRTKTVDKYARDLESGDWIITIKEIYFKTERVLHSYLNGETIIRLFQATEEMFPLPADEN